MRSMRFVLLALIMSTSAVHAGPLGTVWRAKVGKGCPGRQSTTHGLVVTTSTGGTLHDATKGTATAFSRPAVLKDGYFFHVVGDTYVYGDISKTNGFRPLHKRVVRPALSLDVLNLGIQVLLPQSFLAVVRAHHDGTSGEGMRGHRIFMRQPLWAN